MRKSLSLLPGAAALAVFLCCAQNHNLPQPGWSRPPRSLGGPPSDAVVLFDGKDASQWVHKDGSPAKWPVENGAIVCNTGSGDIFSKQKIGSAQIHVEFAIPYMPQQHDQARGNSGVYLQGRYEIQVLDSYQNPTYADGSCGALYGQYPPLVNASRKPEQWQSYDIIFHAPQCAGGQVTVPGNSDAAAQRRPDAGPRHHQRTHARSRRQERLRARAAAPAGSPPSRRQDHFHALPQHLVSADRRLT